MGPDDYDAGVVLPWFCESEPETDDSMPNELCDSESDVEEKREEVRFDYGADWDSEDEVSETDFCLPTRAQSDNVHLLTGLPRSDSRSTPYQKPVGDVIIQDGPMPDPSSGGSKQYQIPIAHALDSAPVDVVSESNMSLVSEAIHILEDCHCIKPITRDKRVRFEDTVCSEFGHRGKFGMIPQGENNRALHILTPKAKNGISVVNTPEWHEIVITVDSGACDTVMPTKMCSHISILENAKVRAGFEYEVANGQGLPNLGERRCYMMTENSITMKKIAFQCADVHKALLSVSALADQGYDCVLSKAGGELRDTVTGDTIPLHRRDNLYFMKAWVKQDPDFTRPV